MNCAEAHNRMHEVIDGELSQAPEESALKAHCASCASCREEFETIDGLHKRMQRFAADIKIPVGFEDRLKGKLSGDHSKESSAVVGLFSRRSQIMALATAAAAVALVLVVPAMQKKDASGTLASRPAIPAPVEAIKASPAKAGDLIANFAGNHSPDLVAGDTAKLASALGFPLTIPSLEGFKHSGSEVCEVAGKKFVRLTYSGQFGGKQSSLVCYVCPSGAFDATGLDEHVIGGRKVCCGQMNTVAMVYIPAKKQGADLVLVAQAPKSELMEVALSSHS